MFPLSLSLYSCCGFRFLCCFGTICILLNSTARGWQFTLLSTLSLISSVLPHFAMIMMWSIFICFVCNATYAAHCFSGRRCSTDMLLLFSCPSVILIPSFMMPIWPDQLPFWIRRHFNLLPVSVIMVQPRLKMSIVMAHRASRMILIQGLDRVNVTCSLSSPFLQTMLPFNWSGLSRWPPCFLMTIRASSINMSSSSTVWFMPFIVPIKWSCRPCAVFWLDIWTISVGSFSHIHISIFYIIMIRC